MKSWNVTGMNITITHSLESCMNKTLITESWSQGPELVRKKTIKTII